MTFQDYIMNPMGRSNAVFNSVARQAMEKHYKDRYGVLLLRESGKFNYKFYKDEKNNRYYAYYKIPSETVKKFYYDVIIEFYADEKVKAGGKDLFQYQIRCYSNDPAFVYTYAYVFAHNHMFIDFMRPKMSQKALKERAAEKNPGNNIGYVKTIYFLYLDMRKNNFNKVDIFDNFAKKLEIDRILEEVQPADDKIKDRQEEGKKVESKSKRNKITLDKIKERHANMSTVTGKMGNVGKIIGKKGGNLPSPNQKIGRINARIVKQK